MQVFSTRSLSLLVLLLGATSLRLLAAPSPSPQPVNPPTIAIVLVQGSLTQESFVLHVADRTKEARNRAGLAQEVPVMILDMAETRSFIESLGIKESDTPLLAIASRQGGDIKSIIYRIPNVKTTAQGSEIVAQAVTLLHPSSPSPSP